MQTLLATGYVWDMMTMVLKAYRYPRVKYDTPTVYPVQLSVVGYEEAPDGGGVFLAFSTEAPGRGNYWQVGIPSEDFSEVAAAMMKADPIAAQKAFEAATSLPTGSAERLTTGD